MERRSSFAPSTSRRASLSPETARRDSTSGMPKRRSMSSTSLASSSKARRRASVQSFQSGVTGSDEIDDGDDADLDDIEEWEGEGSEYIARPRRKKRDEPMSPLAVVLYVVFFYIIWQILTRSDEHEIFAGLSPSSILSHTLPEHSGHGYHMPYHLPHIPSPLPPASAGEGGTSMWRIVLGVAVYPIYLAVTLLAIPLPFLLNALHLVWDILSTLLYPVTSTVRILTNAFLLTPLGICRSILAAFYPVYVFVGSVIGVGCVMGMGAGWAGRRLLNWALGRNKPSKSRSSRGKSRSGASSRSRTSRTSRGERSGTSQKSRVEKLAESSGESPEKLKTPVARVSPLFEEVPVEVVHDRTPAFTGTRGGKKRMTSFSDEVRGGHARSSGREPVVVGIRKRGVRDDDRWD